MRRLVATGAKRFIAATGQHDYPNRFVPSGAIERIYEFLTGTSPKRIHYRWTINRYPRDAILAFKENVFVAHGS